MRTITVDRKEKGQTLAAVLKARLRLSWSDARALISDRRVRIQGQLCLDPVRRLHPGQTVAIADAPVQAVQRERPPARPNPAPKKLTGLAPVAFNIVHLDEHLVVVDKPAGITTMRHSGEAAEFGRGKKFLPKTLIDFIPKLIGDRLPLRAVHRLDKDTTGLVVFARSPEIEQALTRQFKSHAIMREYWAVVRGRAKPATIESLLVEDRGDGRRGSKLGAVGGKRAVTHVDVIEAIGDYTWVKCRLETGRTHQVRIHLGEAGTPICGERVYDRPLNGAPRLDRSGAARTALHAFKLGFKHPVGGEYREWRSPMPDDMIELLARLRRSANQRDEQDPHQESEDERSAKDAE